ncbi:MAG TPA: aminotransferase class III-fold pyridoxal phosphate-dependent enzyme [Bacteroides sp.]|nr:aminotransferase class III-fold pyridoxal phosphate-dependent enzyme [Bacteroides sp.]
MIDQLIRKEFGFQELEIQKLVGYENENYRITGDGVKYVFKTYNDDPETLALVEAENNILQSLQKTGNLKFPAPVSFSDGSYIKCIKIAGEKKICRMLTFLEGEFMAEVEHTENLFQSFGRSLALMDLDLQPLSNYTIKARQWEWDIQYLHFNEKLIKYIPEAKNRSLVRYFMQQFRENVFPVLPDLKRSIIHNDANEWNVLVNDGEVSGIIDFGDLVYSPQINELAIAITYASFDKKEPLEWASIILKFYHRVLPIEEIEVSVLYYLIAARLCTCVCNAAYSKKENPANEYTQISVKRAWRMLHRWIEICPVKAENVFRSAIGLPAREPARMESMVEQRHSTISTALSLSYRSPLYMQKSAFQYMYDAYGNTFLDAYNNIPHVGHSHPRVVEAGQRQMTKLNTNTRYLYDALNEYSEKLLSKFPKPLDKVFFVNSGSAASDLAIRMAQEYTGLDNIMVMEHGYHGQTQTGIDISDYKFSNTRGEGKKDYILKTAIPDTYRGKYTGNDGSAGRQYALEAIEQVKTAEKSLAAFISEPVVGCGGQVPLARGYLKALYPEIRKQGGVCISDEVQVGFGRLGNSYWGFEEHGVIPDIVILGKPMGNGHPVGAVVTTTEIADRFSRGVEFFSSFGGNPVSCAIGSAVLDVIEEEKLQENAKTVGDYYQSLFRELQKDFQCIGDVRGSGLFIGIEIVKSNEREPDTKLADLIKNALRDQFILIGTDGPFDNVLKTKPPMCFTRENAGQVSMQIFEILKAYFKQ